MTEKDKLVENLVKKSGLKKEEIDKLISEKVDELSGLISEEGAVYIIANELGVRLESETLKKDVELQKIEEITESKVPVSLVCKVIRKYDKVDFSSANGNSGSVQSILVGDETGIIRIVFWQDKTVELENVKDGDILKILNAFSRENNQNPERLEVHYGQYSTMDINPEGINLKLKENNASQIDFKEKKISELEEGDRNVQISGIITDFEIPRFYLACPNCFKKVSQEEDTYTCNEHNEVEALKVPIVNLIIDDGSGTVNVVGFRDRAEKITGINSEEIIGLTEDINKYREFSKKIVGAKLKVGGNLGTNSMTGENQILSNQILDIDFKNVDEVTEELLKEDKKNLVKEDDSKNKSNKDSKSEKDLEDMNIEEIDIDEDLL